MTELEKTAQRVIESIDDLKHSYTYIEESPSFLKIGIGQEFINIKTLSLLYEIIKERVPNIIWGDIERRENGGMCINFMLG